MTPVWSIDPRTGAEVEELGEETSPSDLDGKCQSAADAASALEAMEPTARAAMLRSMADNLDDDHDAIVRLADRETALGADRLKGELARTSYQLRLFADVVLEGSYLEATIDHAADTPMGPRPDLRRYLLPIGTVAVFAASNFPLAFSVPGGDTASALAAGCAVVVKAHEAHPATSRRCLEALARGAATAGAPDGTVTLVYGQEAGRRLVTHPAIRAVGFTGSLSGGRALFDLASTRPTPIPFYGEMGSVNPVIVTRPAAAERASEIAQGYVASFTLGTGQFCTKPGLLFVPTGPDGDRLKAAIAEAAATAAAAPMLSRRIRDSFEERAQLLASLPGVRPLTSTPKDEGSPGFTSTSRLLVTTTASLAGEAGPWLREECFGPVSVVVDYSTEDDLVTAVESLDASLTVTLHVGVNETGLPNRLVPVIQRRAGRVLYNGFPTGVAVSWAMNHGGPYPATTSELHTSVGVAAMRRFLRPICYQNAPAALLPPPLREENPWSIPRRIDGHLTLPHGWPAAQGK